MVNMPDRVFHLVFVFLFREFVQKRAVFIHRFGDHIEIKAALAVFGF